MASSALSMLLAGLALIGTVVASAPHPPKTGPDIAQPAELPQREPAAAIADRPSRFFDGTFVQVRSCCFAFAAPGSPMAEIRRAGKHLWKGGSRSRADFEVMIWAKKTFRNEADFLQFLVNWANVETGGTFNPEHVNKSGPRGELNVGLFQINQAWATQHNNYGHDSNPRRWSAPDALDPFKSTHWALYHLLSFYHPAGGNLIRMLDAYWHGTFHDPSPYARGVLRGHTVARGQ